MNKAKESAINVSDESKTTSLKEMTLSPIYICKWILMTTSVIIPFVCLMLAITCIDVNSRGFMVASLPFLANTLIILCLALYVTTRGYSFSSKEIIGMVILAFYAIFIFTILFFPETLQDILPIVEKFRNTLHSIHSIISVPIGH